MKKHLLIIDDCPMMCSFIARFLAKNYRISTCDSAEEALAWLSESSVMPDLILTDFNLKTMDGLQFIQELRTQMFITNIPIIMLSAVKDSAKRLKVLEAGASDYLTKPFHPKELELRVNSLLEVGSQRPSANVSAAAATQTPQPNATQPKAEQPNVAQPSEAPVMQPKKMPKSSLKRHVSYLQRFYMSFML